MSHFYSGAILKPVTGVVAKAVDSLFGKLVARGEGNLVNLNEETFSQALFNGAENVAGYSVWGTKGLVGNTFNRNVFYWKPQEVKVYPVLGL
ncbi:hypothetical protein [Pedobacter steynii]|uniref:Uncharacterized protein n=1 Tax=Pedobacter steynii TaxID=430522 RepID=A0A1D7QKC6_9SPHI|nr:hypothetical protein [Pedobacter steynii]AOM79100.1 hypothetical protein BFS30_19155 [Pedobacter steynii]